MITRLNGLLDGLQASLWIMDGLIQEWSTSEGIVRLSRMITRDIPAHDLDGETKAVETWVRQNIRYVMDPADGDMHSDPETVLDMKCGDCDDMVILAGALLASIGHTVQANAVQWEGQDTPSHAVLVDDSSDSVCDPVAPASASWPPQGYRVGAMISKGAEIATLPTLAKLSDPVGMDWDRPDFDIWYGMNMDTSQEYYESDDYYYSFEGGTQPEQNWLDTSYSEVVDPIMFNNNNRPEDDRLPIETEYVPSENTMEYTLPAEQITGPILETTMDEEYYDDSGDNGYLQDDLENYDTGWQDTGVYDDAPMDYDTGPQDIQGEELYSDELDDPNSGPQEAQGEELELLPEPSWFETALGIGSGAIKGAGAAAAAAIKGGGSAGAGGASAGGSSQKPSTTQTGAMTAQQLQAILNANQNASAAQIKALLASQSVQAPASSVPSWALPLGIAALAMIFIKR